MVRQTVATLIEAVCHQFNTADLSYGHGTDNAWDEAVALVLNVVNVPDDTSSLAHEVTAAQEKRCMEIASQRIATRQPLAYLLGSCAYMGYEFRLRPDVLVPRSPIGYLLRDGLQAWLPSRVERILDLCCGSGCLGLIAAFEFPQARVTLLDVSDAAVACAFDNVELHNLASRVSIMQADVTQQLEFEAPFDLILCNPPYVDAADMRVLPPEFLAEPELALAAGEEGLAVISPILKQLPQWLTPHGLFVGEVGASAPSLLRRYPELPFIWPELHLGGEGVFLLEAQALNSHTAPAA